MSDPGELILYQTEDGRSQIQLRAVDGTVWLTQAEMAELFDTTPQNVGQHVRNVYEDAELRPEATRKNFFLVREEGTRLVRREVTAYNLDVILAVGYRVRSPRGSQFRQWATTVLREYLVKGFALNDERLKDPAGLDYFDELLQRIREIRASEKRFYQKVRALFATSVDYDSGSETAKTFFATIQNKLVFAVTGRTAAELVLERCDPNEPNMGLTSWKGDRVRKSDVVISKNYLTREEIEILNTLTTQFLDFAELRARRRQHTTMADWISATDRFLTLNEFGILNGPGKVSAAHMKTVVEGLYKQFDEQRRRLEAIRAAQEEEADIEELLDEQPIAELTKVEKDIEARRKDG
ncbi:2-hydroxyacid dehydrogenase [Actinomadura sp. NBRC 104412]|uniref:virulence RhuM family protein n=1 Tax=Actinomadura sp. NBRC 104412 TaxID=3032203 RepID=UPI0024A4CE1D|nr:virulence RhuM family protein [Actinomadura sp. NBRC 104412]GLZ08731.1 2-hydroxyacid dehydrogenase [Actinomadura sp. NBRC 104412]